MPSLLTLSDVFCTGHHAAVSAHVSPRTTVTVIGDGAVGLCAVLAARRLGAERIILPLTPAANVKGEGDRYDPGTDLDETLAALA